MATRREIIERIRRQIYNDYPASEATITVGLVNSYLNDGIAVAAKQNYKENGQLEAVAFVNSSFYSTFKNLAVSKDSNFIYKVTLPQVPVGLGATDGISTLTFNDSASNQISRSVIWITENQRGYFDNMRAIPNKLIAYYQGNTAYIKSTIMLTQYTANVTMVSAGLSSDLDSVMNFPSDYFPLVQQYITQQLILERNQPVDQSNDGADFIKTT